MKFTRVDNRTKITTLPRQIFRRWWDIWYIQLFALIFALFLGVLLHRSGATRPITEYIRNHFHIWEMTKSMKDEIRMYEANGLPTLYIDLPFENYQKLLDKRNEAINIGILNTTDADFVKGSVHLQDGQALDARLRLKGDYTNHLRGDKWSFRIKITNGNHILGLKEFSISTPGDRNYLNEWAFHQNLIQEGLLTTRYQFVNVLLNGKNLGIYALEEHFTPELIESQGRRQGLILRYNEDILWNNIALFSANDLSQGDLAATHFSVTSGGRSAEISPFQATTLAEDPILTIEAKTAMDLLRAFQSGERTASEVFDANLWGKYFAISDLWSAGHSLQWKNIRFYYNPVTGLIEPVGYDAQPFFFNNKNLESVFMQFIPLGIFNDIKIRAAYARELERVTQPEYITKIKDQLILEHDRLSTALYKEFSTIKNPVIGESVVVNWSILEHRANALRLELEPVNVARGVFHALNVVPGSTEQPILTLDIVNMMIIPMEVIQIEINGKSVPVGEYPILLPMVTNPNTEAFNPIRIVIPLSKEHDLSLDNTAQVNVVTRLVGLDHEFSTKLSAGILPESLQIGPAPAMPTLSDALQQHPFLEENPNESGQLLVSQGTWDVQGDLILPPNTNLTILAGTVLKFREGSILYTTGSLSLLGTSEARVLLTAQESTWGGIVVLNASQDSQWKYAIIEKTAGISRDGWIMTGGITFYQSHIVLNHTVLGNNQTEDAINVIDGTFKFINCEFANTSSDAFDSDFSAGEVRDCYFHDITGDAVDVSGTQVTVSGARMERISDKGVSVGEESHVTVKNTWMDTVGIGVASKDLSEAVVTDCEIRNVEFAALAAYIKKPVYGPAKIHATNLTTLDIDTVAVVQNGSVIQIDGKLVDPVDLDVDQLYMEGILGK